VGFGTIFLIFACGAGTTLCLHGQARNQKEKSALEMPVIRYVAVKIGNRAEKKKRGK